MIDLSRQISALVQVIRSEDYPNVAAIANLSLLDVSGVTTAETKRGVLAVYGARLDDGTQADVIGVASPRKLIHVSLPNSSISYQDVSNEIFGSNQRIQHSKYSRGLAVLFEIDGLTCGFTASGPNGVIESLFCEEPKLS
jgi:hypothetical protein